MRTTKKRLLAAQLMIACLLLSTPAFAWDAVGHKTVARIAWDNMKPQTRGRVIAILSAAPADSDMRTLVPPETLPPEVRAREFFMAVSNWADFMRDGSHPERQAKYHHPTWHYCDFFWEQTPSGPRDRPDLKPDPENAIERLQLITWLLGDDARADADRAIDLAWVLHVVGDVHQPLHCSARVTDLEPKGDQGGNLFKLESNPPPDRPYPLNLHAYWDSIVNRAVPRQPDEKEIDYISRVAKQIEERHQKADFQTKLRPGEFSVWVKEGFETSKAKVYPASLKRLELPSQEYLDSSWQVAEPAIALAGYRLAETLDRLLGY
ncbi:MAG TPA: S1/P1 nuclease [Blastocatellia bacterium]|nr:S1/P1 nuclease [Blastocatellia bacterium]